MSGAKRIRAHSLSSYCSLEHIQAILDKRNKQILHHAYIVHDRDIKEDGTPKDRHVHILLYLSSAATVTQVRNWFADPENGQNTLGEAMHSVVAAFRYLCHKDNPEKAPYDDTEVIVSNEDRLWFERQPADVAETDTTTAALYDTLDGRSIREMVQTYGRDYIIHKRQIDDVVRDIKWQEGDYLLSSIEHENEFKNKERIKDHIDECHKAIIRLLGALDAAGVPDAAEHWRREYDLTKFEPYEKLQNYKGR